jgi:hypothetical protein
VRVEIECGVRDDERATIFAMPKESPIEVWKDGVWTQREHRWLLTADEQHCPECKSDDGVCWMTYVWDGKAGEAQGPWCAGAEHGPKRGCCFCVRKMRPGAVAVPCQECQAQTVAATKALYAEPAPSGPPSEGN